MHPPPMDPEKLKAVIAGYSQGMKFTRNFCVVVLFKICCSHLFIDAVGKAFLAGTILVFGGATAVMMYTANKLELHSVSHGTCSRLNYTRVNIVPTFKKKEKKNAMSDCNKNSSFCDLHLSCLRFMVCIGVL